MGATLPDFHTFIIDKTGPSFLRASHPFLFFMWKAVGNFYHFIVRMKNTVFKGFSAFTRSKVLKINLKVLTFIENPLLTRLFVYFTEDFTNFYIIRILKADKTPKTIVNKGSWRFLWLNYNPIFYVLTMPFITPLIHRDPLLTGVFSLFSVKLWLKHAKVFTCNISTCCISYVKFLHAGIKSAEFSP